MDGVVDGLDVIDFPGVDDRDETISELAELLLAIAQVVVFVVDYRSVSSKYYLARVIFMWLSLGKLTHSLPRSGWSCWRTSQFLSWCV